MTLEALLNEGIQNRLFPAAACAVNGEVALAGTFTYDPSSPKVDPDTLWDIASLTKIVATTSLAMIAFERGLLSLDAPAADYWPDFAYPGITVRHLLLHRSGLPPYLELWRDCRTREQAEAKLLAASPRRAIPPRTIYSCTGFLVLRKVLESALAQPFAQAFQTEIAAPLNLSTTFNPPNPSACVPTAYPPAWRLQTDHCLTTVRPPSDNGPTMVQQSSDHRQTTVQQPSDAAPFLQGSVHDPAAFIFGGVSGNAGLFASLNDLIAWSTALTEGRRVSPETLALFTRRADSWSTRALGFDTRVPGARHWSPLSFGHTGYTGTSLWHDPRANRTAILLTNRVHPDDTTDLKPFRLRFHELAARM